ncbi:MULTISPECIES: alpha/beta hydrolase [Paraburkholderia]|uniref:Alpha/beta hydrolase n=1 Tax=Paraburkholderia podalyriae TaxID=1938811 RepID=A0ABR7PU70_9BURK|nr:alpha/beta hydrolase [Paraburkholderia podalyriae]MBC8749808.1 alpha/beta hydrolase [Paraburkholderia podalyriae]
MNEAEAGISEGMHAFIRSAATFQSATADLPDRRAAFARQCAHFTPPAPHGLVVSDQIIGGVMTRCFRPARNAPRGGWPVLVLFHGGGWTVGSHATHDWFAHALLERADLAIVAVDYRLAPEARFPAPLDDGLAVWDALGSAATSLQLDPGRRAVAGDSAGGTLAAAVCIALRDRVDAEAQTQPQAQVLMYPVVSASQTFASMKQFAQAPMLSARGLADSIALYVPNESDRRLSLAMPLESHDLSRLPPALMMVAMQDVLRDQCIEYAACLRESGVEVEVWRGDGLVHAGLRATLLAEVAIAYDHMATFLIGRGVAQYRQPE